MATTVQSDPTSVGNSEWSLRTVTNIDDGTRTPDATPDDGLVCRAEDKDDSEAEQTWNCANVQHTGGTVETVKLYARRFNNGPGNCPTGNVTLGSSLGSKSFSAGAGTWSVIEWTGLSVDVNSSTALSFGVTAPELEDGEHSGIRSAYVEYTYSTGTTVVLTVPADQTIEVDLVAPATAITVACPTLAVEVIPVAATPVLPVIVTAPVVTIELTPVNVLPPVIIQAPTITVEVVPVVPMAGLIVSPSPVQIEAAPQTPTTTLALDAPSAVSIEADLVPLFFVGISVQAPSATIEVTTVQPDTIAALIPTPAKVHFKPVSPGFVMSLPAVAPAHIEIVPVTPVAAKSTPLSPERIEAVPVTPQTEIAPALAPVEVNLVPALPQAISQTPVSPAVLEVVPVVPSVVTIARPTPVQIEVVPVVPDDIQTLRPAVLKIDLSPVTPRSAMVLPAVSPETVEVVPQSVSTRLALSTSPETLELVPIAVQTTRGGTLLSPISIQAVPQSVTTKLVLPALSPVSIDVTPLPPEGDQAVTLAPLAIEAESQALSTSMSLALPVQKIEISPQGLTTTLKPTVLSPVSIEVIPVAIDDSQTISLSPLVLDLEVTSIVTNIRTTPDPAKILVTARPPVYDKMIDIDPILVHVDPGTISVGLATPELPDLLAEDDDGPHDDDNITSLEDFSLRWTGLPPGYLVRLVVDNTPDPLKFAIVNSFGIATMSVRDVPYGSRTYAGQLGNPTATEFGPTGPNLTVRRVPFPGPGRLLQSGHFTGDA